MGVRARIAAGAVVIVSATVVAFVVVPAFSQSTTPAQACGTATQGVVTTAFENAARIIYLGERRGGEVTADVGHITSAAYLAQAVADNDVAATVAATHRLVYTPRWHIVRLRVLSESGRLLADIGGPSILAPVRGRITYQGSVVGSFVMSVQDDLGYEKLVTRFTGLPIELYRHGAPLMGRDWPASEVLRQPPADGTRVTVSGARSVTVSYDVSAFPTGRTRVVLAIPQASAALASDSCVVVNELTYGRIARTIAELFDLPKTAENFVTLDQQYDTAKLVFVREGSNQIASTSGQAGPPAIPTSGTIDYDGQTWLIYSFVPVTEQSRVRIYLLFPDTAPTTGPTGVS
jgi:hypothetical protein